MPKRELTAADLHERDRATGKWVYPSWPRLERMTWAQITAAQMIDERLARESLTMHRYDVWELLAMTLEGARREIDID